jgi:tetratricopeptide (TPR) repeat protein
LHLGRVPTLVVLVVAAAALAADQPGAVKEAAVRLYDQGRYEEARKALEELDGSRALDGPLLYRLFFCEKSAGRKDDAQKALERARVALETELASSTSLEAVFYLANTYANLGRAADAREAAQGMTAKIESGQVVAPTSGIGLFQIGKLYQDQSRQAEASSFYAKAVDAFDLTDGRYAVNAVWALRYVGNVAFARADFEAAERALARLAELRGVDAADWEALAAARARLGKYALAGEAWRASVKLDPANTDDAQYASRLAAAAALLAPLPSAVPGSAPFSSMSQTELEAFLKARSEAAMAAQASVAAAMGPEKDGAPTHPLDPKRRAEVVRTLRETRQQFVAAGLEYSVRHYGIRDKAFGDGYAALIFQERSWELPPDPPPVAKDAARGGS